RCRAVSHYLQSRLSPTKTYTLSPHDALPISGAGVFSSAAAMDKVFMKSILLGNGIPTSDHVAITDRRWANERKKVLDDIADLGEVVFVKPARAGSSVGISRVTNPSDADTVITAVEAAREHDP